MNPDNEYASQCFGLLPADQRSSRRGMGSTKMGKSALAEQKVGTETVSLAKALSSKTDFKGFTIWLVGDTPLITHAWSEKARREMLQKQVKAIRGKGKEARDPQSDFVSSLYEIGDGGY